MSKKLLAALFAAIWTFILSAQTKGVVISVAQNQATYDKLDSNDKLYARSAFQTFVGNLTLLDEVSVRTESNDSSLRQVQKQSQIDASKGLGTEDSAYALDQASKATLRIEVSLVKYKTGYKLEYSVSNIETMQIVSSSVSDSYFELENIDEETDKLSYTCIKSLYGKGYISEVPYNVEKQLTHSSDTSENYAKYILELTKQIEECQDELDSINKKGMTAAERAEAARKEQALQLRIQAAENAKRKTEENLRKYNEELAKKEKQEAELRALNDQKRSDLAKKFQEKIKQSQEQQAKLNKELTQALSLEKRIELIEADRNSLSELEDQLIAQLELNEDDLTAKMYSEIEEINSEPWRLAEKDASGNPTSKAIKYRESQVKKVQEKYTKLIETSNNELKSAFASAISTYEKQIADGIKELEATEFVYRSFESGSHLVVEVGNYDGEKCNWMVVPDFKMEETTLITNIPDISVLGCSLSYKDISGRLPVEYNGTNDAEYAEYMDFVELSDLCFRTSTPYIYGTLYVKVKYNNVYGDYRMVFNRFTLNRMEDNKLMADYSATDYNAILKGITFKKDKDTESQKKKQEQAEKQKAKELVRQETHSQVQGLLGSIIRYWTPNMKQKSGITVDIYGNFFNSQSAAFDIRAFMGGNGIINYGVELTFDDFDGFETMGCMFNIGTSVNFGCFRPYVETGLGVGAMGKVVDGVTTFSTDDVDASDLRWSARTGLDLVFGKVSLGAFINYEGRIGNHIDFVRNYTSIGVSLGTVSMFY